MTAAGSGPALRPGASSRWDAPGWWVAGLVAALSLARLAFLAWGDLDLSPDEAHY